MSKLLAYETIVKAHEGDPNAVNAVIFDSNLVICQEVIKKDFNENR